MRLLAILALWLGLFTHPALAAPLDGCVNLEAVPKGTLTVAIRPAPPFIQNHPIRGLEGISIDLWENISRSQNFTYAYVCLNLKDTLTALNDGAIDVAISPLTISKEREQSFDFTHQYFTSGLVFAGAPETVTFNFKRVFYTLLKALKSNAILFSALTFAFATALLAWLSYRNRRVYQSPMMNPDEKRSFSLHLLFMSILNMAGMRKDIFSFGTAGMQLVFLMVVLLGATLSAGLGGMITASFMHSVDQSKTVDTSQLGTYRFSTLKGSTAESYLVEHRDHAVASSPGNWLTRESWADVLGDVTANRADLVIGDWVQLAYLANSDTFRNRIQVHTQTLRFEPYGWGLPKNSPLRDPINQDMIGILRSDAWPTTVRAYIGSELPSIK